MTDYQKRLKEKYWNTWGNMDQGDEFYLYMFFAPEQYDAEEDVIDFMDKHPHASFEELLAFVDTVIPTIELVPDDELEDED